MVLFLAKHSLLAEAKPMLRWPLYGLALAGVLTMAGTYARTGLVCLVTLLGLDALYLAQRADP